MLNQIIKQPKPAKLPSASNVPPGLHGAPAKKVVHRPMVRGYKERNRKADKYPAAYLMRWRIRLCRGHQRAACRGGGVGPMRQLLLLGNDTMDVGRLWIACGADHWPIILQNHQNKQQPYYTLNEACNPNMSSATNAPAGTGQCGSNAKAVQTPQSTGWHQRPAWIP